MYNVLKFSEHNLANIDDGYKQKIQLYHLISKGHI